LKFLANGQPAVDWAAFALTEDVMIRKTLVGHFICLREIMVDDSRDSRDSRLVTEPPGLYAGCIAFRDGKVLKTTY
jgi:hypothetical protein